MHHQSHAPRRAPRTFAPTAPAGRVARLLGTLSLLLAGLVVAPVAPAAADSTYLCTGYASCRDAGYPNAGYAANSGTMYWRMYTGHNCTNYVAYRMVKSGMPNTRPWDGGGNASNWGVEMASITDQTPMVGAVAWWKANVPGAGSSGHVAYVERVISSTEIIVSEDSWGGDFHWRRITKPGRGWPSGFIHFNDVAVTATSAPALSGTPQVGEPVTVTPGRWKPVATLAYQWYAGSAAIEGATGTSYTPTAADKGKQLTVKVTASRTGYKSGTASVTSDAVQPGTMTTAQQPSVEGSAQVDEVLRLRPGSYQPEPSRTSVKWFADGEPIAGATGSTLRLEQEQIDKRITVKVVARTDGYRAVSARTEPTEPVLAGTIEVTSPFEVQGRPRYGRTLTVAPGTVQPADATATYTWLRNGVPVRGATGTTYVPDAADVGHQLALRVDLTRRSYRSTRVEVPVPGVVRTTPTMQVATKGKPGRAVVVVRLQAPGVEDPTGRITVRVGRHVVVGDVVGGRVRMVVRDLFRGQKKVQVRYAGTDVVEATTARTTVEVLPRR